MAMCSIVLLPFIALADTSAGFAPGAVWLSKTNVEYGETVQIYTVLYNSSEAPVAGTVSFFVDNSSISEQLFELTAGTTKIISTTWKATDGAHLISAMLGGVVNKDTGEAISLDSASTTPLSIEVASPPPPVPSPIVEAVSSVVAKVQEQAPAVISAGKSAYDSLEYLRQNAVRTLEKQLIAAETISQNDASYSEQAVLGTSTVHVAASADDGTDISATFSKAWRSALSGMLYVAKVQYFFYPLLLLVFYILYKLLRTLLFERRYSYSRDDDY